jgi:hypothetical protein
VAICTDQSAADDEARVHHNHTVSVHSADAVYKSGTGSQPTATASSQLQTETLVESLKTSRRSTFSAYETYELKTHLTRQNALKLTYGNLGSKKTRTPALRGGRV